MEERNQTIGEVAAAAGVNTQTLRYYERRGIVQPVGRSGGGYRLYAPDTARLVRFIKQAQELGFTLDEIVDLLSLRENGDRTCHEVRDLAAARLATIEDKINQLAAIRDRLAELVDHCGVGTGSAPDCALLDALDAASTTNGKKS